MGWKKLPTWLKGGIVALLGVFSLSIILGVYNSIVNNIFEWVDFTQFFFLPGALLFFDTNYAFEIVSVLVFIISILVWFFIGAIIGWIVGKIKK